MADDGKASYTVTLVGVRREEIRGFAYHQYGSNVSNMSRNATNKYSHFRHLIILSGSALGDANDIANADGADGPRVQNRKDIVHWLGPRRQLSIERLLLQIRLDQRRCWRRWRCWRPYRLRIHTHNWIPKYSGRKLLRPESHRTEMPPTMIHHNRRHTHPST